MALTVEQHIQMLEMLNKVSVKKYVSHDDYEELIVADKHGNKMEIKFYANSEETNND